MINEAAVTLLEAAAIEMPFIFTWKTRRICTLLRRHPEGLVELKACLSILVL